MSKEKYIYESPDGGKTVYSRKIGDTVNKRKLVARKSSVPEEADTGFSITSTVTDETDCNEFIGTVPILSATEDIGWNNTNYTFAPTFEDTGEFVTRDTMQSISNSIDDIKRRLSILEPNLELNEKYQGLKQLYQEYKAMEKLLSGPDKNEED